jgi:asparagine synthase (glutamine-hydrolysing)
MARIGGIVSSQTLNDRESQMRSLAGALGSGSGPSPVLQRLGAACFALAEGQPEQAHASERLLIVLDGCIYNRSALGSAETDASLLAGLYEKHGFRKTLQMLNGDFAIALFDRSTRTLWLGRDRFGIKPLYYVSSPKGIAFASRPRAILRLPGVDRGLNRQFLALFAGSHYRYFDNQPEQSPYSAVSQLPAAHLLRVTDESALRESYWSLEEAADFESSEAELAERYRELLFDAVALRLKAAKRSAFTLSGGMDSSSVLASAVHTTGTKQHAFSSVYVDKTYDESDEIRSMLAETVAEWHPVSVGTPDVLGLVRSMVEVHDEPVATATWLAHYLLCQEAARQGFNSLFGGLGGDELNAGEYEHFFYFFADLRAAGEEERLRNEIAMWIRYHDHPVYRKSFDTAEEARARLVDLGRPGRCRVDRKRLERYAAALAPGYFDLQHFEPVMEHPFHSYLKNRTYQDLTRETIPCCLRAEDRQCAAFGLENFLPFFDHRLVEMMFRVPGTLKYRAGVTKHLLRQAMRGVLPEATRTRIKKTGWNAPAHVWFSGAGREPLMDLLRSQAFRERGIYDVAEVLRLADEHEEIVSSGRAQDHHMMFFWQLVNLELWLQSLDKM